MFDTIQESIMVISDSSINFLNRKAVQLFDMIKAGDKKSDYKSGEEVK